MPYESICAQINNGIQVVDLMKYLHWFPEKVIRSGDVYLALCPIHHDEVFRTLVLNPRNNTYVCKHVNCPGSQPADFIDLISKTKDLTPHQVVPGLVDHFGSEYFQLNGRQKKLVEEMRAEYSKS